LTETNLNTTIDGIVLTGKIDKIELNERGNYEIVDYKTGKYKDISKVNPKTKNEHEYLTQLKFYKLLLESDVKFKGKVDNCFIDFIETDKKKNLLHGKTKGFNFNDNDLQGLVDKIKEVKEQMLNLHFEKTKDHSICRYCRHKDHCWPEGVPKW
jgi:RecB family exonuclease